MEDLSTISKLNKESETSKYTLQMRGLATIDKEWKKYIKDEWALKITKGNTSLIDKYDKEKKTYKSIVLRSIFFERMLNKLIKEMEIKQVIIYAAGYDTKSSKLNGVDIYEVDLPENQKRKIETIKKIGYPICNAKYIPFDLTSGSPIKELEKRGFDKKLPTIIIMEGLLMYLTISQIKEIFKNINDDIKQCKCVIFDYFYREVKSVHKNEPFLSYDMDPRKTIGSWFNVWMYRVSDMYKNMFNKSLYTASGMAVAWQKNIRNWKKYKGWPELGPLKGKKIKVMQVQYSPDETKEKTKEKISELINKKMEDNIDIIILPELSLTKYEFESKDDANNYAEKVNGESFTWASNLARKYNSYFVIGIIEDDVNLYNTMIIIGRDGSLIDKYRKKKLFVTDTVWANPGDSFKFISLPEFGNVGLGICMDISTNNWKNKNNVSSMDFAYFMKENKVRIILFISSVKQYKTKFYYPQYQQSYWNSRLVPLFNSNCLFIATNRTNNGYCGSSCSFYPSSKYIPISSLDFNEDAIVYSTSLFS